MQADLSSPTSNHSNQSSQPWSHHPDETDDGLNTSPQPLIPSSPSEESDLPDMNARCLSDRLTQLAAVAWAAEQDGNIQSRRQQQKLFRLIQNFEAMIEDMDDTRSTESPLSTSVGQAERAWEVSYAGLEEKEIHEIHTALANTVACMRLRQQEQRHLHQLTVQRLESVAQECLTQQNELSLANQEVDSLRVENRTLGEENDGLRHRVTELEDEAARNQIAVNAMSSAVKGLEGYLESADRSSPVRQETPTPRRDRKVVYRGKGRFRGRYYVRDGSSATPGLGLDGTSDAQDLQDGVKAWLRGFRDVEEELRDSGHGSVTSKERAMEVLSPADDDWGDFESPSIH